MSRERKITSLVLKSVVIVSAVLGTILSAIAGREAFMGGGSVFMYFTIQSNLALAVISAVGFRMLTREKPLPDRWYTVKFVGAVSITLTGMVFCFVLAPTMGGAAWTPANILTHVVVPICSVADFFVTGVYGEIAKSRIPWVTVPPLVYAAYAGIGYALGREFAPGINYPYFFLNWGSPAGAFGFSRELPFMGCVWWILALLVLLLLCGAFYLRILELCRKRMLRADKRERSTAVR